MSGQRLQPPPYRMAFVSVKMHSTCRHFGMPSKGCLLHEIRSSPNALDGCSVGLTSCRRVMALLSIPRPYVAVVAVVLICSIFLLLTPIQPASVTKYLDFASGFKAGNLGDIRNETLGVCIQCPGLEQVADVSRIV